MFYLLLWILLSIFLTWIGQLYLSIPIEWIVLLSLNISTFLIYGLDKIQAINKGRRVPEKILFLISFLGGSIGALAAMHLFRHKTRKTSFQLTLALLILIQIAIVLTIIHPTWLSRLTA